jgi:hypothetical protein
VLTFPMPMICKTESIQCVGRPARAQHSLERRTSITQKRTMFMAPTPKHCNSPVPSDHSADASAPHSCDMGSERGAARADELSTARISRMCNQGRSETSARRREQARAAGAAAFRCSTGDQGKASAATHIDTPVLVGHDGHSVGLAQSDGSVVALVPVIVLENLKKRKCDKVEGA